MDGPRRTASQRTGQLAEAAFAKAVIKEGMLWHPTSAGNDFGIDGKVEIVENEILRGAEFNVQIKGTSIRGPARETISLGSIKITTLAYWTSKLLPTLLVVHDETTDRLFWSWLHEILNPIDVLDHQHKGHKRTRLSMPTKRLNRRSWHAIRGEAQRAHEAVLAALEHAPVRSFYNLMYCHAADVTDVLTDVLTAIAYWSPVTLAMQFANADHLEPEQLQDLAEKFAAEMPAPPAATLHTSHMFVLMQIEALDHELQAFLYGKAMFPEGNPIVRSTESIQRTLRGLLDEIKPEYYGPDPEGPGPSLRWARVDLVKLVYGVGLILVLLRDYQRELRPFLFPIWGQLVWPVPERNKELPMSSRIIHDLSYEHVTSFAVRRGSNAPSQVEQARAEPSATESRLTTAGAPAPGDQRDE